MNVFVLCTGRCGSRTFSLACKHIENYSTGHESRRGTIERKVAEYPTNHIEIDNSLSWLLGRLETVYGDDAFYVHLKRDRDAVVQSFANRGLTPKNYARLLGVDVNEVLDVKDIHRHYYDTVNANIEAFLRDKSQCMEFWLGSAESDFRNFWDRIDAEGDLSASLEEWNRKYNSSNSAVRSLPVRVAKKAARVVKKFPGFLREA